MGIFSRFAKSLAQEISRWLLVNRDYTDTQFSHIRSDIQTMSQTLGQRLDAVAAALHKDTARIAADIAALNLRPGDAITEAQVAVLEAAGTGLTQVSDALHAVANPTDAPAVPPGAPVVT